MGKKLNIGSGNDYKEGFVNLDCNKNLKADIYANLEKKWPFPDNSFDYIYASNIIEHFENIHFICDELHRVAKNGAIIEIIVPHYTGRHAFKILQHKTYFGIGTFGDYTKESVERFYPIKFDVLKERLWFFRPRYRLSFINGFFNLSKKWMAISERFNPFGFDEIYYKLKVVK
ncbi:methyltransferase domain protein [archaeon BMS3Abin17]|nr:methyltransferase domain protein [archaeon BMS3Abin17]HDZ61227.1 methyltransferase domain-containing protein [Candidatus Pacearchaeota archaeon]